MTPETLKKLQEARFPQYIDGTLIPFPTMSDIIIACGRGFRTLIRHTDHRKKLYKPWEAVPNKKLRPDKKSKNAETPDETVALLWLELVDKQKDTL